MVGNPHLILTFLESRSTPPKKLSKIAPFDDDDWVNPPDSDLCLGFNVPDRNAALQMCTGYLVPVRFENDSWACCLEPIEASSMTPEL